VNTLSTKEKHDLQNVFEAISDVKPRGNSIARLKFLMYYYALNPLISLPSRLFSRRIKVH